MSTPRERLKQIIDNAEKALAEASQRTITPKQIVAMRNALRDLLKLVRG